MTRAFWLSAVVRALQYDHVGVGALRFSEPTIGIAKGKAKGLHSDPMATGTARRRRWAGLLALAVLATYSLCDAAPVPANKLTADIQFEDALRIITMADEAAQEGRYEEARELYSEAYHAHAILGEQYPRWNPDAVRKRIGHCTERMNALGDILNSGERETTPPPTSTRPAESRPIGTTSPAGSVAIPGDPTINRIPLPHRRPAAVTGPAPSPAALASPPVTPDPDIAASLTLIKATARQRLQAGSSAGAREILMEGLRLDPDDRTIRLLLGLAQCLSGRFEDAAILLRTLLEEHPADAYAHLYLAGALTGLGRLAEASDELRQAIRCKPQIHQAHFNLALILLRMDPPDTSAAREHYRNSLRYGGAPSPELDKRFSSGP